MMGHLGKPEFLFAESLEVTVGFGVLDRYGTQGGEILQQLLFPLGEMMGRCRVNPDHTEDSALGFNSDT